MFVTYRRRKLYRRMRQTAPIAGPGAGAGLVITVSAVSVGLRDAQNTVLRALYGVGSELTVTQTPSGGPPSPSPSLSPPAGTRGSSGTGPPEGTSFRQDSQFSRQLGPLPASSVVSIARLPGVRAVAAGLTLTDRRVSAAAGGREEPGPSRRPAPISTRIFGVSGVDPARPGIGPLSSARISAGRAFTAADAGASVALLDSAYANQQPRAAGSTITVAGAALKVIGIVGLREGSAPSDVCIPLQGRSAWPAWRTRWTWSMSPRPAPPRPAACGSRSPGCCPRPPSPPPQGSLVRSPVRWPPRPASPATAAGGCPSGCSPRHS